MIIICCQKLINIFTGYAVYQDVVYRLDVEGLLDLGVWGNKKMKKHDYWDQRVERPCRERHDIGIGGWIDVGMMESRTRRPDNLWSGQITCRVAWAVYPKHRCAAFSKKILKNIGLIIQCSAHKITNKANGYISSDYHLQGGIMLYVDTSKLSSWDIICRTTLETITPRKHLR
jgi:hypothetical protein